MTILRYLMLLIIWALMVIYSWFTRNTRGIWFAFPIGVISATIITLLLIEYFKTNDKNGK